MTDYVLSRKPGVVNVTESGGDPTDGGVLTDRGLWAFGASDQGNLWQSVVTSAERLPSFVSIPGVSREAISGYQEARGNRYIRRFWSRRVTETRRHAGCGRWLHGGADGSVMVRQGADGTAYFSGLQTCGSVWACAACAAKIRQERAEELDAGLARWLDRGHGVVFLTLTLPHTWGDRLAETFDGAEKAWRCVRNSRAWRTEKDLYGLRHYVRTLEVTLGPNGWHPHVHALLLTERPLLGHQVHRFGNRILSRWSQAIRQRLGVECGRQGFWFETGGRAAGKYITKVQDEAGKTRRLGMEMTRHDLKQARRAKSLTPFRLLDAVAAGDGDARRMWTEFERVTKGRRCLTWSRGARDDLGLNDPEQRIAMGLDPEPLTDAEIAAREVGGDIVLQIGSEQWSRIVRYPGADAGLLWAVESGGLLGAGVFLLTLREVDRGS